MPILIAMLNKSFVDTVEDQGLAGEIYLSQDLIVGNHKPERCLDWIN